MRVSESLPRITSDGHSKSFFSSRPPSAETITGDRALKIKMSSLKATGAAQGEGSATVTRGDRHGWRKVEQRRSSCRDLVMESTGMIHAAHPCAAPCGQPSAVQIGFPADWSRRLPNLWATIRATVCWSCAFSGRCSSALTIKQETVRRRPKRPIEVAERVCDQERAFETLAAGDRHGWRKLEQRRTQLPRCRVAALWHPAIAALVRPCTSELQGRIYAFSKALS